MELESETYEGELHNLCKFGLTPLQGRLYVSLVRSGPSQARTLASTLNVNRVDVYRILRGLRKRGLVEVELTEPSMFAATPPRKALDLLLKQTEKRVSELKDMVPSLSQWLDSIANTTVWNNGVDSEFGMTHFRLKYGSQYLDTLSTMIRNSRSELCKIWSSPGLKLHSREGILDEFATSASRGVRVRGVVEVNTDIAKEISSISRYAELRYNSDLSSALRYTISDSREVFVSGTSVPLIGKDLVGFWTDNISVVSGFVQDFERLWKDSAPLGQRDSISNSSQSV